MNAPSIDELLKNKQQGEAMGRVQSLVAAFTASIKSSGATVGESVGALQACIAAMQTAVSAKPASDLL